MQSILIKDKVVEATSNVWVETVEKEAINLSKMSRLSVDLFEDEIADDDWCVFALDSDRFMTHILGTFSDEGEARSFYEELVNKLQAK